MLLAVPLTAAAQAPAARSVARADSLLARGEVARAESIYYATADAKPRDPIARAALGRYIAARGAPKVGVVLLEEARRFGGDERAIARELAPIYELLGDHAALARLPGSPLSSEERVREAWLVSSGSTARIGETVRISYVPEHEASSVGRVAVRANASTMAARIDPQANGIAMDRGAAMSAKVRTFPANPSNKDTVFGVIDSLVVGSVTLTNVPVTITKVERGPLSIGLGYLARFAPTFDARRSQLTLRGTGRAPFDSTATRYPLLLTAKGPRLFFGGQWLSAGANELRAQRTTMLVTIDPRRGSVFVSR